MTPRENMLRILRCDNPGWIPITAYADPYNHPAFDSLPEPLAGLMREKVVYWDTCVETVIPLSEHLGIDEYLLSVSSGYKVNLANGVEDTGGYEEDGFTVRKIRTRSGEIEERKRGNYLIKPFITSPEDLGVFREYVESWRYEPLPEEIERNRRLKAAIGDNGILQAGAGGTPLGMMYRFYSNMESIIYLIADVPDQVAELFDAMEEQYVRAIALALELMPEIDVIVGMDDTSTTLLSPAMFEKYNVELTNRRADLVAEYGKFYVHHSCGLIRNLLEVYRKTRMSGVNAFTRPPIGDVTYSEGRKLLGDKICIQGDLLGGVYMPDRDTLASLVREVCEDAKEAGDIFLGVNSPDPNHSIDILKYGVEDARKHLNSGL